MRFKEFSNSKDLKIVDRGECLNALLGKNGRIRMSKSNTFDMSMLNILFVKTDHLKEDCPEREDNEDYAQIIITSNKDSYESAHPLIISSLKIDLFNFTIKSYRI